MADLAVTQGGGDVLYIPDGYNATVEAETLRQVGLALTNGDLTAIPPNDGRAFGEGNNPCNGWPGVTCSVINDIRFVDKLSITRLRYGTVAGTLSPMVNQLLFLTQLVIRDIGITGTLPTFTSTLRYIGLQNNQISGTIPTSLRVGRTSATDIHLNRNKLSGSIPADLFTSNQNARINLSQNTLQGFLPASLASVHALESNASLDLSANAISGYLPTSWPLLGSPIGFGWTLNLASNFISGLVPALLLNNTYYSEINLSNNLLSGALPQAAFENGVMSTMLQTLDITDNSISGYLPNMVVARRQISELTTLLASGNSISGFLTASFMMSNPNLMTLRFADNALSGVLPTINTLTELDITRNKISGSMPRDAEFNFPLNMHIFKASYNFLSGDFSAVFSSGSYSNLQVLDVSHNDLQGTIPYASSEGTFTFMDLSYNYLTGTIPSLPESLEEIYLNNNQLSGALYPDQCNDGCYAVPSSTRIYAVNANNFEYIPSEVLLYTLEELYAQENKIVGELDQGMLCGQVLRILDLSYNNLTGTLPPEISLSLEELHLNGNGLSGLVPPEYGYANLTKLKVSNNLLSGPLPVQDVNLKLPGDICAGMYIIRRKLLQSQAAPEPFATLQIGHFDSNGFSGELDLNWFLTRTPFLEELKLGDNALNGPIFVDPGRLGSLPTVTLLDLSENLFEGEVDSRLVAAFPNLQSLTLNGNTLGGVIPFALGSLSGLRVLKLDSNQFEGLLPATLGSLAYLEELTLSINSVEGTIPGEYGNLGALTHIEVFANQGLSGCIPAFARINESAISTQGTSLTGPCTSDVVPPVIACPPPTTLNLDAELWSVECGVPPAPILGVQPVFFDPCPAHVRAFLSPLVTDDSGNFSLTYFPYYFAKDVATTVIWDATDAAGNRATCESSLLLVTQLELVALEVTQSVQDWNHSVPLVSKKATMVRAFVQLPDNDARNVTGDNAPLVDGSLKGYRNGVLLGNIAKVNLESSLIITKNIRAGRGYIRGSFNFLLPESWLLPGALTVCFVAAPSDDYPNISPVACLEQDSDGDCCISVELRYVSKPYLRFIRVRYLDEATNTVLMVSDQVMREQWRRFRSMLPIPGDSLVDFRQFDFVYGTRPPLRVVNNALDATRIIDNLPQRCWYIGVLKGMGGGLAELNGETAAYYVGSAENSYSCGYARNRGVHEFLHNMGIEHARQGNVTACSSILNTNPDEFPFLEALDAAREVVRPTLGPLGDSMTEVYGTDPQLAATGAPSVLAFMSPRFVFALMSYCQPINFFGCQARWIDSNTYAAALEEIHIRAPAGPQPISLDTPQDISMFRGSIEYDGIDYNVVLGPLLQVCTTAAALAKDVGKTSPFSLQVVANGTNVLDTPIKTSQPTADLIECSDTNDPNCATQGGSNVFGSFSQDEEFPGSGPGGCGFCFGSFDFFPEYSFDFFPEYSFDFAPIYSFDFAPIFSFDGYPFFFHKNASYMLFDGWPWYEFDAAGIPKSVSSVSQGTFVSADFAGYFEEVAGNYSDFDGITAGVAGDGLQRFDFQLAREAILPQAGVDISGSSYSIQFSFASELEQVVIDMFELSANSPRIQNLAKAPSGDIMTDAQVQLCFDISDIDGGDSELSTTVQYCPDYDGTLCSCEIFTLDYVDAVVANNAIPRHVCLSYDKKKLKATTRAVFRVYVTDGLRTVDSLTPPFLVSNNAPDVEIVFPTNGTTSSAGQNELFLSGSAHDVEDGVLDATCRWYEATDPANLRYLATGAHTTVNVTRLRGLGVVTDCETKHTIRLVCRDFDAAEEYAEVVHTLLGGGNPVIICPGPVLLTEAYNGTCSAIVTYPAVSATTTCGQPLATVLVSPVWAVSGAAFPGGDTVVKYRTAESLTNLVSTCSFTVRVDDTQPPVVTCSNLTVPAVRRPGTNGGVVWYDQPVYDNCGVRLEGAVGGTADPGDVVPFGRSEVEYYGEDFNANRDTCAFDLNVFEIACAPPCEGPTAGFVLEFGLTAGSVGPVTLSREQVCLWNYIMGVVVGVDIPDDPCTVSSAPLARRRRGLLQGGLDVARLTRIYFPTDAAARAAEQAVRDAIANGSLLMGLSAVLAFLNSLTLSSLSVTALAGVTSDPHFQGPCGQRFDFMGAPGESFCLMTSEALHLNGKMMGVTKRGAVAGRELVEEADAGAKNTWIQELGILYGSTNITVSAESLPGSGFKAYHGRVYVNGVEVTTALSGQATHLTKSVQVDRRRTRVKLTLGDVATLQVEIVRASFWEAGHGPGGNFLNLKVLRLANAADWHGVLGQTFGKSCESLASGDTAPVGAILGSNATRISLAETDKYRTSGILAGDCAVSKFRQHV